MKKTSAFILLLTSLFSLVLSSCNDTSFSSNSISSDSSSSSISSNNEPLLGQYSLSVIDEGHLIHDLPHLLGENSKTSFNAGDVVYFSTSVVMDASIILKLNDMKMEENNPNFDDGNSLYTPHSFVMPAQNSVLKVSVVDGFFSNEAIPLGEVYNWIYYLEADDIISATYTKKAIGNPHFANFNMHYAANQEELTSLYNYLKNQTVTATDYRIPPGSQAISIAITTKDNKNYQLTAHDNRLEGNNKIYSYLLDKPLPEFSTLLGYSFDSNSLISLKVNNLENDSDASGEFDLNNYGNLANLIFKESNQVFNDDMNEYNKYKFVNSCGYFIFQNEKTFLLYDSNTSKQTMFEVINDYSFSHLKKI